MFLLYKNLKDKLLKDIVGGFKVLFSYLKTNSQVVVSRGNNMETKNFFYKTSRKHLCKI